jgi:hypothetical protein
MSRPESQAKMGFYPAPPEAIEQVSKHLALSPPSLPREVHSIVDPCAGEGAAVNQLAKLLGNKECDVYMIELDDARARKCRESFPNANTLGPASVHGVVATPGSIGIAYVNPPFDNEMGGGRREEVGFVETVTRWLAPRGILVLIVPTSALNGYSNQSLCEYIDCHFRDVGIWRFPDACRKYNEVVIIGVKRAVPLPSPLDTCIFRKMDLKYRGARAEQFPQLGEAQPKEWWSGGCSIDREPDVRVYSVPAHWPPNRFQKVGYTEAELVEAVRNSPLGRVFEPKKEGAKLRPPLPLGGVHVGMVIASGLLDGMVFVPGRPDLDHVSRGVSVKEEYYNESASGPQGEPDPDTGEIRWKDVYSEKITTTVRAVDRKGVIHDFKEETVTKERIVEDVRKNTTAHGFPEGYDFELAAKLARVTVQNGATPAEEEQAQARLKAMKEGRTYHSSDVDEEAA